MRITEIKQYSKYSSKAEYLTYVHLRLDSLQESFPKLYIQDCEDWSIWGVDTTVTCSARVRILFVVEHEEREEDRDGEGSFAYLSGRWWWRNPYVG